MENVQHRNIDISYLIEQLRVRLDYLQRSETNTFNSAEHIFNNIIKYNRARVDLSDLKIKVLYERRASIV